LTEAYNLILQKSANFDRQHSLKRTALDTINTPFIGIQSHQMHLKGKTRAGSPFAQKLIADAHLLCNATPKASFNALSQESSVLLPEHYRDQEGLDILLIDQNQTLTKAMSQEWQ
jgi:hypothetical protein